MMRTLGLDSTLSKPETTTKKKSGELFARCHSALVSVTSFGS